MPRTSIFGMLALVLASGCASWFMVGSEPHTGAPPSVIAKYTAPRCTKLDDKTTVPGPAGSYMLTEESGAPVLYELDANQDGARIANHWADAEGDHFFTYVKGHQGWHYILPTDHSQPGKRLILLSYSTQSDGAIMKPVGQVALSCDLVVSR